MLELLHSLEIFLLIKVEVNYTNESHGFLAKIWKIYEEPMGCDKL
jgi:hypothetical protein